MTIESFRELALSFPAVVEHPHFDRAAFKVEGKRIFTTLHESSHTANVKLSPTDQALFCEYDPSIVYAVPNKWGGQGWTTFELGEMPEDLMLEVLHTAYQEVFKKK